jgi:hypothetical protein
LPDSDFCISDRLLLELCVLMLLECWSSGVSPDLPALASVGTGDFCSVGGLASTGNVGLTGGSSSTAGLVSTGISGSTGLNDSRRSDDKPLLVAEVVVFSVDFAGGRLPMPFCCSMLVILDDTDV